MFETRGSILLSPCGFRWWPFIHGDLQFAPVSLWCLSVVSCASPVCLFSVPVFPAFWKDNIPAIWWGHPVPLWAHLNWLQPVMFIFKWCASTFSTIFFSTKSKCRRRILQRPAWYGLPFVHCGVWLCVCMCMCYC